MKIVLAIIFTAMKNLYYYRLEDAEQIKLTFNSWIGKKAHIGKGIVEILKSITIKQKKQISSTSGQEEFYLVEFEFENGQVLSAHEFFYHNSINTSPNYPVILKTQQANAA
jgi:hypothetical protein